MKKFNQSRMTLSLAALAALISMLLVTQPLTLYADQTPTAAVPNDPIILPGSKEFEEIREISRKANRQAEIIADLKLKLYQEEMKAGLNTVKHLPEDENLILPLYKNRDALGSYGDILLDLNEAKSGIPFLGHAAIVCIDEDYTMEAYPKTFSPIEREGVQKLRNKWRSRPSIKKK